LIDVQILQRLSKVGDGFRFLLDEGDAFTLSKLARYPLKADERWRDFQYSVFNVNVELLNPYFSLRFWNHCIRMGAQLPAQYLESLTLDMLTVRSESSETPVQHFVSSWRDDEGTRVAGAVFTSDLSFLVASKASVEQKALLVRHTIGCLVPSLYDVIAIGFELPARMKQAAAQIAKREPHLNGGHFDVFRASNEDIGAISAQSLTARLFLSATHCHVQCFVVELRRFVPGTWKFVVFVLSAGESERLVSSSRFWSCAITPLAADSLRTQELRGLPGQKSRWAERRKMAEAAAIAAFSGPATC
jgi:hypothetical protein